MLCSFELVLSSNEFHQAYRYQYNTARRNINKTCQAYIFTKKVNEVVFDIEIIIILPIIFTLVVYEVFSKSI